MRRPASRSTSPSPTAPVHEEPDLRRHAQGGEAAWNERQRGLDREGPAAAVAQAVTLTAGRIPQKPVERLPAALAGARRTARDLRGPSRRSWPAWWPPPWS